MFEWFLTNIKHTEKKQTNNDITLYL
jgi:hypothetical protein